MKIDLTKDEWDNLWRIVNFTWNKKFKNPNEIAPELKEINKIFEKLGIWKDDE